MLNEKLLAETAARYSDRQQRRDAQKEKLKAGLIFEADQPARVQKRVEHLMRGRVDAVPAPAAAPIGLERVLGKNNLISVNYLDLALAVSRSVGRIQIRSATGQLLGHGTGSLVSARLLMTNNHVLASAGDAASSRVEFNYQDGMDGTPLTSVSFDLEPQTFFLTDERLDFTLVAVAERARETGSALSAFGWNRLIEQEGKVIIGECLNIIQHPNGERKQLALRENLLVDLLDDFLHYETDTAPGSSGSPVFNDQWEVVGLHHSGVPRRDEQGRILASDGSLWTDSMGEQRIDWLANEGVRVSRIMHRIRAEQFHGQAADLRDELLAASPPPVPGVVLPGEQLVAEPGVHEDCRRHGHLDDPAAGKCARRVAWVRAGRERVAYHEPAGNPTFDAEPGAAGRAQRVAGSLAAPLLRRVGRRRGPRRLLRRD